MSFTKNWILTAFNLKDVLGEDESRLQRTLLNRSVQSRPLQLDKYSCNIILFSNIHVLSCESNGGIQSIFPFHLNIRIALHNSTHWSIINSK